jgi:ribosomal protein S27AE
MPRQEPRVSRHARRRFLQHAAATAVLTFGAPFTARYLAAAEPQDPGSAPTEKPKDPPDQKKDGTPPAKDGKDTPPVDEFKITRKDDRGRDYRVCPQCNSNMYRQDRVWTCDNCGYSYAE